jgi:phosphoenolpyruvate phosphomutase
MAVIEGGSRSPGRVLRDKLGEPGMLSVMGAHDAFTAILAERTGYDGIWAGGLGISATHGVPDSGLLTLTELVDAAATLSAATTLPVIADGDTGFGDVNVLIRAVEQYESRGVSAMCIEDKALPKRNSFRSGHCLLDREEFAARIGAAASSRADADFVLVARTEALIAGESVSAALHRAALYEETGADAIVVQSRMSSAEQIVEFAESWNHRDGAVVPLIAIPTTYFETPATELESAGVKMVIYANHALRAGALAMEGVMTEIIETGSSLGIQQRMISMDYLFRLTGTPDIEEREMQYADALDKLRQGTKALPGTVS